MKHKLFTFFAAILCAVGMDAAPAVAVNGKLPGAFSVSDTKVVYFSQGNLQATTSDLGANWTWSFAENQYDYIGAEAANTAINGNGSVSINSTVDLFGWSTAATYYGIHNSLNNNTYSGDFVDWGTNAITNGGNIANAWRTLTADEWNYLFLTRTDATTLFAFCSVNGVNGLVILPDNWTTPDGVSFTASTKQGLLNNVTFFFNSSGGNFSHNTYNAEQWSVMESAGAVFLPAAGVRNVTEVVIAGSYGILWSATPDDTDKAYYFDFGDRSLYPRNSYSRYQGKSARLVSEVAPPLVLTAHQDPQHTSDYYSTFYDGTNKYELPEGTEAYVATRSGDALNLTKIAEGGQVIPAANAVILKANSSSITLTPSDASPVSVGANDLEGTDAAITNPSYGSTYVLSAADGVVGFYKLSSGATIPAHKAYITITGSLDAPRRLRFVFDSTTDIENPTTNDERLTTNKFLRNGQLIIIRGDKEFNAQGQMIK